MDSSWIFMIAIWAFFELFGFLMKKDFAKRMKIGAIGSTLIVSGITFDGMSNPGVNQVFLFMTTLFMFGAPAVIIYFLRLKAEKISKTHLEANKKGKMYALIFKFINQILAIIIGSVVGMLLFGVVLGGLYLAKN